MALLIKTNGDKSEVEVPQIGELEFLQGLVGGMIELAPIIHGSAAIQDFDGVLCNEEGKMLGLPANMTATKFAGYTDDILVGDVLFFKDGEVR
jgi:hypothetical protein